MRVAGAFIVAAVATLATAKMPAFSWETVPVFWHAANGSGPLSSDTVTFVASHFAGRPVTIEKMQAEASPPAKTGAEDKIVAAAAAIHAEAARLGKQPPMVLFYLNSVMNWNMYTLAKEVEAKDLIVRDKSGKPVLIRNQTVFDLRQPEMQQMWLGTIKTALQSGYISGVFADRGNFVAPSSWGINSTAYREAEIAMLRACQDLVNATGFVISNNEDIDGVGGRMFERWGYVPEDYDNEGPVADVQLLVGEAVAGRVAEAHSGEPCTPANFNRSLAQFLVAAGEHAYYACTEGWTVQSGWDVWYPEYDKQLGVPAGPASKATQPDGTIVYHRSFASGTTVRFTVPQNVMQTAGCICWSDGTTTGPPGCDCK